MFELMVILFIVGYVFIALEHTVNINKAATALFMGISLWVVYILGAESILGPSSPNFSEFINIHPQVAQLLYMSYSSFYREK